MKAFHVHDPAVVNGTVLMEHGIQGGFVVVKHLTVPVLDSQFLLHQTADLLIIGSHIL